MYQAHYTAVCVYPRLSTTILYLTHAKHMNKDAHKALTLILSTTLSVPPLTRTGHIAKLAGYPTYSRCVFALVRDGLHTSDCAEERQRVERVKIRGISPKYIRWKWFAEMTAAALCLKL